jgi:adenosylcobinamide kinase/adenosylcobinamide-phosphate guanylyltransferase
MFDPFETPPALTLVLGGARSGKSRRALALAERWARESPRDGGLARVFVATARPSDAEMAARIARHRADRGAFWTEVEAPLDLAGAIAREARDGRVLVVDCLTLWLFNLGEAGRDADTETRALLASLSGAAAPVILVSNELGLGLVPETALGRDFRDRHGRLNQAVAEAAELVEFIVAGQAIVAKPRPLKTSPLHQLARDATRG